MDNQNSDLITRLELLNAALAPETDFNSEMLLSRRARGPKNTDRRFAELQIIEAMNQINTGNSAKYYKNLAKHYGKGRGRGRPFGGRNRG